MYRTGMNGRRRRREKDNEVKEAEETVLERKWKGRI
jgi:hypothetical protein